MTATADPTTTGTPTLAQEAILLAPGEGRTIHPLGMGVTIKAGGAQTAGGLTVLETVMHPGQISPPAIHDQDDEAFYVLEGEFTLQVGDRKLRATPGAFVYVPRGVLHDVICEGTSAGRLLMLFTPGRMERFFEQINALPPGAPDLAALAGIAQQFATHVMPPSR